MIEWNPLVNMKISLEGEHISEEGIIEELEFENGKKRSLLKNSFIPKVWPSLGLMLNHRAINKNGLTEYEEFLRWYDDELKHGILPFYFPRIGYRQKPVTEETKKGETGIYQFLPDSLTFEGKKHIWAAFGIKETGYLPAINYKYLLSANSQVLFINNGKPILV